MSREPEETKRDSGNVAAAGTSTPPPSGSEIVRGAVPKDDDRNLVAIEKDFDFEDRVWFYWSKYRTWVLATLVGLFLAVLFVTGYAAWQASRQTALQEDFQQATTIEQKIEFASNHTGAPLAGAALLEVAHSAYAENNYESAAQHYADAKASLTDTRLLGVARLGEAVSQIKLGDTEAGRANLETIFRDPSLLNSVRHEAGHHLAALYMGEGNFVQARSTLSSIRDIGIIPNAPWKQQATALLQQHPDLATIEAAEAATRAHANAPATSTPTTTVEETAPTAAAILEAAEVVEETVEDVTGLLDSDADTPPPAQPQPAE
ncbi:MAG: hypothetical protein ACFBZ8_01045 [Opitutales bacterium]